MSEQLALLGIKATKITATRLNEIRHRCSNATRPVAYRKKQRF